MYAIRSTATALLILAGSVAAEARESRNIMLRCSPEHRPIAADIAFAIETSDYLVSPKVRREMLARVRAACAERPTAVLSFVPKLRGRDERQTELATK